MKRFVLILGLLVHGLLSSGLSVAEEHPLSTIQGTDVDLKVYDHAIAGQIRDFVIFGNLDESKGISELLMKRDGQVVRTTFGRDDLTSKWSGVIRHVDQQKELHETQLVLEKIDRQAHVFTYLINGKPVSVQVSFESFASNHYVNPTYRAMVDGKALEFKLLGRACLNYSAHLNFMILGALIH